MTDEDTLPAAAFVSADAVARFEAHDLEAALYAHMMQGSATVAVGSRVERGQRIGTVGNSGNTSEPHLHVHFTDRWEGSDPWAALYKSQGVPMLFWNAHVLRGHRTFALSGSTPLEPDVVLP